jgi:hypothetical protein
MFYAGFSHGRHGRPGAPVGASPAAGQPRAGRPTGQLNVNRSAGAFLTLCALFTVAFTSTVPASRAGAVTVHFVAEAQLTDVA